MAIHFYLFAIIDHRLQFFSSDTDQSFSHTVFAAIAGKFHRKCIRNFQIHSLQQNTQHFLRCLAGIQHCGDGSKIFDILLQLTDRLLLCKRHQLHNKTAGLSYGIISVHQHSQSHNRGNLLRYCKIISQILCDLTGLKIRLSHIGVFQAHVADHAQDTGAHCTAHIQFALGIGRQDHIRHIGIPLHMSVPIRSHRQSADRTVSFDLQGDQFIVSLQHTAHHNPGTEKSSQRCCNHGAGIMCRPCSLHCLSCSAGECPDLCIRCGCTYHIIFHFIPRTFLTAAFFAALLLQYILSHWSPLLPLRYRNP